MTTLTPCVWRNECPLSPVCYRATAEPDEKQSYFAPQERGDECQYFIPAKEEEER
jgi:hypothetical protein